MSANLFWLTEEQFAKIVPFLPRDTRGKERVDDRRIISGIVHVLKSGGRWIDAPSDYGPRKTLYNRFIRWRKLGIWDQIFDAVSKAYDGDLQMVDSSSIRVHQHAANGKKGARKRAPPLGTSLTPDAWGARGAA